VIRVLKARTVRDVRMKLGAKAWLSPSQTRTITEPSCAGRSEGQVRHGQSRDATTVDSRTHSVRLWVFPGEMARAVVESRKCSEGPARRSRTVGELSSDTADTGTYNPRVRLE
jgi:hypothetical protein